MYLSMILLAIVDFFAIIRILRDKSILEQKNNELEKIKREKLHTLMHLKEKNDFHDAILKEFDICVEDVKIKEVKGMFEKTWAYTAKYKGREKIKYGAVRVPEECMDIYKM